MPCRQAHRQPGRHSLTPVLSESDLTPASSRWEEAGVRDVFQTDRREARDAGRVRAASRYTGTAILFNV
jgi:hypothetical protein